MAETPQAGTLASATIAPSPGAPIQDMSYDMITNTCLQSFDAGEGDPLALVEKLLNCPGVPMHDPIHHYILPAALLTVAALKYGLSRDALQEKLSLCETRASKILAGFCGWWGSCGSAVGCGVFACVWLETSPKQEENWAAANAFTARCLDSVASVGGPRCCKRTTMLSLKGALENAPSILGVDLGPMPEVQCQWYAYNKECRKEQCPFYPEDAAPHPTPEE